MPNIQFSATAEGLPNFTNATHVSLFLEFTPDLRKRMEQTVEHLIWLLDTFDDDPDLEENGDHEPNLGFGNTTGLGALGFDPGDDRELDLADDEDGGDAEPDVDDEPNGDDEPSLGALEIATQERGSQTAWAAGNCSYDRELDECDKEWDFRNAPAEL